MQEVMLIAFGSIIGLMTSIVRQWMDNSKEKRTRWDEERLKTYASFTVAVRAAAQRAGRLVRDGETSTPNLDEYVRDRLRDESFAIEQIHLIASKPVVESALNVSETLRAAVKDWPQDGSTTIDTARHHFYTAVRRELSIDNH